MTFSIHSSTTKRYFGKPPIIAMSANAGDSARIIGVELLILKILIAGNLPQIFPRIVTPVVINMVNLIWGKLTLHVQKRKLMGRHKHTLYAYLNVAVVIYVLRHVSYFYTVARYSFAGKHARIRAVMKHGFKIRLSYNFFSHFATSYSRLIRWVDARTSAHHYTSWGEICLS